MSRMRHKKAKGGKVEAYNPPVPESKEAEDTKEGFKKGGAKHAESCGRQEIPYAVWIRSHVS